MADVDEFDQDDDYHYDEVAVDDEIAIEDFTEQDEENFDALLRSVQATKERDAPPPVRADLTRLPVVVDDFIRNFLVKHQLRRTIESFELEWYERYGANPEEEPKLVPDVYIENARLVDKSSDLERELSKHKEISQKAMTLWEHVKKERDLHRRNHSRVMQEKSQLSSDLKRLQTHAMSIEPTVSELRQKYEACQKEKMLLKLERDKLQARISGLEDQVKKLEEGGTKAAAAAAATKKEKMGGKVSNWPADNRPNPYVNLVIKPPQNPGGFSCKATFQAHSMAVTCVSLHPKKQICATSSDDGTWRLFSLPQGELIMTGEGHRDWVAGVCIHPKGNMCATASGDKTVKLWDFVSAACKSTLKAHTDGVWCVDFQETGELLASGSLDHSARIWDVETGKCRQTMRGHVDAVNSVIWQPYSNIVCTGSGDKTVSLWDARANFCAQTFYGHNNSVAKVAMAPKCDILASCDADGRVIVWDTRMIEKRFDFPQCGPHPANCVSFDRSGTLLAVASDDAQIKMISLTDEKIYPLKGHEDAVQCAVFDPANNAYLVSCGSDTRVRHWVC